MKNVKTYLPLVTSVSEVKKENVTESITFKKTLQILLVDDEEIVCNIGKEMLEISIHSVSVCKDGIEAIEIYKKNWKDIQLVILDMVMPKLAGTETYYVLKDINPNVKVLLTSGYSITGEAQNLLDIGAQGFIQKPFIIAELAKSVAEIFPYE
ncbi:MAG: response regulator [Candidatus Delongbacteria bacterium]|nr:response regulator [Candidatus Delongbacteria bacterium]MDD4204489.1 response regulator [Candidatus Delongbacteria bacterium]